MTHLTRVERAKYNGRRERIIAADLNVSGQTDGGID